MAIVLTNDTDLVEPIRLARADLGLHLALLSPSDSPRAACAAPSMSSRSSATAHYKQANSPTCSATAAARYTDPERGDPLKR